MEPTLCIGERILINKLAYAFGSLPKRGDIIVFTPPPVTHAQNDYIKRIIGMPGEQVEIKDGKVYIIKPDSTIMELNDEPYIFAPATYYYISPIIPENHYFVMGDNRNNSSDSHTGWTVSLDSIVGKACFAFWPKEKFGVAPDHKFSE
jgi:signal peptidase I